jgi:hypothetical protein
MSPNAAMKRMILCCTWTLVIASWHVPRTAHATVAGSVRGPERAVLRRIFDSSKRSICVRCSRLTDLALLSDLRRACKRGVSVKVVVDTLTPRLRQLASADVAPMEVRLSDATNTGLYDHGQSYALGDTNVLWYGVKAWSPKTWKGQSSVLIDDSGLGTTSIRSRFETVWNRSHGIHQ